MKTFSFSFLILYIHIQFYIPTSLCETLSNHLEDLSHQMILCYPNDLKHFLNPLSYGLVREEELYCKHDLIYIKFLFSCNKETHKALAKKIWIHVCLCVLVDALNVHYSLMIIEFTSLCIYIIPYPWSFFKLSSKLNCESKPSQKVL